MDEEANEPCSSSSPPSPPPKPSSSASSPNHTRDASLQQILRQFDPLSPERQAAEKAPAPPPKDTSPPSPNTSPTRPALPEKDSADGKSSFTRNRRHSTLSIEKPPPAEPDQPFEFHRFLEQMRNKSADGVVRYMKRYCRYWSGNNASFLHEFSKRSWTVSEQQKIVHDFLHVP